MSHRIPDSEAVIPFPVYAAMLSLQLIVTVADRVPQFDAGAGCRESSVRDCLNMEKIARDKLIKDWPTFTAQDKTMCVMEEKIAGPPSYVGWLTCLGINANARRLEAKDGDNAGMGSEARPERHGRARRKQ